MAYGLTEALNKMNELGVFSYALPFMIIFAIIFGLLQKVKIFGDPDKAKGVNVIIAIGVAGMSLLYDMVPTFFAEIFPRFGIGLAVFLVLIISLGFFLMGENGEKKGDLQWIGWVVGIGVVVWAFSSWGPRVLGGWSLGYWFEDYLPMILVLILIGWGISAVIGGGKANP
jgi:hypothetical protein